MFGRHRRDILEALKDLESEDLGRQQDGVFTLYFLTQKGLPKDLSRRIVSGAKTLCARELSLAEHFQRPGIDRFAVSEEYVNLTDNIGICFDLLSKSFELAPTDICDRALQFHDSWIRLWAALAMIRTGSEVSPEIIESIAQDPESRKVLAGELIDRSLLHLIPKHFANQESLAEANMVHWLVHPCEMAAKPEVIELMSCKIFKAIDGNDGRFYLFRYRMSERHWEEEKDWMAGVAGPYPLHTLSAHGSQTFSNFDKWDSMSPEEHFQAVITPKRNARVMRVIWIARLWNRLRFW